MAEHSPREDSGLFEGPAPSISSVQSGGSRASLPGRAASYAHGSVEDEPRDGRDVGLALGGESGEAGEDAWKGAAVGTSGAGAGAALASKETEPGAVEEGTPFYEKKIFLLGLVVSALIGIGLLFVILFPVVGAIAQHIVDVSSIGIDAAAIIQPSNTSFTLGLNGTVFHTGVFSAIISFTQPLTVYWLDGDNEVPLGTFSLQSLSANPKVRRAYINQTTELTVADEDAFGRFTAYMVTSQNFTWRLKSDNLEARALKLPLSKGLKFTKDITLNGINNFQNNAVITDFQLPSDSPAGGINYIATTELYNPSPFLLGLGTVVFALSYQGVYLGLGLSDNTKISPGNNTITLSGVLVPHNSTTDLAVVSDLFTRYLNGESSPVVAKGLSTEQTDGTMISWLSAGLQALSLTVPLKDPTGEIAPIKTITIGDFNLDFSSNDPWAPVANTNTVQASLKVPFGFGLSIGQIENVFNISKNGSAVAGLSTPLGASTSEINVLGPQDTEGLINISIVDTALSIPDSMHSIFSQFTTELTDGAWYQFRLIGHARAIANLSIGELTLDPINFNVTSGLDGLEGLQGLVEIDSIDVVGGTTEGLALSIDVNIYNPSNLNLFTGDLVLQLWRGAGLLGTSTLPNLTLAMGNNSVSASAIFAPNNSTEGSQTLNQFVGGENVDLVISGYDGSTNVASLLQAIESLGINATLPGLNTSLLESAALEVLDTTGHEDNNTHVTVTLNNPFTADLQITQVESNVSAFGIHLGSISMATNFSSAGKDNTTSPNLNLDLNLAPEPLFTVTRRLAVEAGLDTEQFDGIVQLGGYQYLDTSGFPDNAKRSTHSPKDYVDSLLGLPSVVSDAYSDLKSYFNGTKASLQRRDNIYTNFNLPDFVDAAFKELKSDVNLTAGVTIGDYSTSLTYTQSGVGTTTDDSINLLLPILALPIVQKIVDASLLGVNNVLISDIAENSFATSLSGFIDQSGPFDASISFPSGLDIAWQNRSLGNIQMPDINITGDVGGNFSVDTTFNVADVDHLTDFTKTLVTSETFEWQISGENLTVSAIGISVSGVSLSSKSVQLKGLNNLANGVVIDSFDLPENDPEGGIHLTIQSTVTNPSQVGFSLSSIAFQAYFGDTNLGPVASSDFTLGFESSTSLPLAGRLIPQDSDSGLADVSTVFNNYVHGMNSNVTVWGDSAGPTNVTWLNEGIKSLQVQTVLPNNGTLDIIKSVALDELNLQFSTDSVWDPSTSSNDANAAFTIPFGFPINITAVEENITIGSNGTFIGELAIPKGPTTTDVDNRIIYLTFSDVPLSAFGDKHSSFQQFLADTTANVNETMKLSGTANTDADTAVGLLSLTDISFTVDTTIAGLQGLSTEPVTVSNLDVAQGFIDYLLITVNAALFNPSNITIGAGDVAFPLEFQGAQVGTADISDIEIEPGNNTYNIDVHYAPQGSAVPMGQQLLENYLQGVSSNTIIQGSTDSTPIESLQLALSEIQLAATIPALHQNLITSASLVFPTDIVQTGVAQTSFVLDNPFTASINILDLTANATFQALFLGDIDNVDVSSSPIHADGHANITSKQIPFNFNLDPTMIIKLLTAGAANNGVDLGPLPDLFNIALADPDYGSQINTSVVTDGSNSTCVSGNQFDVDDAILNALKNLEVTLAISTSTKIDEFSTDLAFSQYNVSAITDETALYLIGAVAPPIVQTLVDQASLTFSQANISNITDAGFDLTLNGSLTGTGPLDAEITFLEPVSVSWEGNNIAEISLPPVCAGANSGVPVYQTSGHLTITDTDAFTSFTSFLLHNPSFEWIVSTPHLRVTALGTNFDGVNLSKNITLDGFNNLPGVTISDFDLMGSTSDSGIEFDTIALIPSPADLGINLGTVGFIGFFEGTEIGPITGDNLSLAPKSETSEPLSGEIIPPSGGDLLKIDTLFSQYVSGANQTLNVVGDSVEPSGTGSAAVEWLSTAFKTLDLNVTLPGLQQQLISEVSLTFPTDIVQTGVAEATFTLDNPFTAGLNVFAITTNATYKDLFLGDIDNVDVSSSPIHADGHSNVTSQQLPFNFNLDPTTIITLLSDGAATNGVDLGPLPDLFAIALANPTYGSQINTSVVTDNSSSCVSGNQFDVDDAILASLKNLKVDLDIESGVRIDQSFAADLTFNQSNIPALTDGTALYLIGAAAPPIVQTLVDQAELSFSQANISNITNEGFDLSLSGSLTNTGPLDAEIAFIEPVTVSWNGNDIAEISLPSVCASANSGVPDYETNGHLSITDTDGFTSFTTFLLHNPSFEWIVSTSALRVTALGTIFDGVRLSKNISLDAFNNLPGVTISDFDLTGSTSDGGIAFNTSSSIPSPADLGIDLGTVGFFAFFEGTEVGPIEGDGLSLAPKSTTTEVLTGEIVTPSGNDLSEIDKLFSQYVSGLNQTLNVDGDSVEPGGPGTAEIGWLSTAFKTLELDVTLPGLQECLISAVSLTFPTDIVQTGVAEATFTLSNPFTAGLNVIEASANATFRDLFLGDIAHVDLSSSPIHADGHSNVTSQDLPFHFNLNPTTIITLLTDGASDNGVDLGPLPDLFAIALANPDYGSQINTSVVTDSNSSCVSGNQFDVNDAILAALKNLQVNLDVESEVRIDESFAADITFNQSNVPAQTDSTALYLIGAVAPPIVQTIVDEAVLTFNEANITNITDEGFDLSLVGSLTDAGPLDALITFVDPVTVTWNGNDIAEITLPPVCSAANSGVPNYQTDAHLTILDTDEFTTFTEYILSNPSFEWILSTTALRVTALGTAFDNVSLSKNLTFKAFNNLPGVTISNFNLPSDDPAGGIHVETDSDIPSPAQLGIDLGTVAFTAFYEGLEIGSLSGDNLFLAAESDTALHLSGRLIPQSGDDLDTIGQLFTQFLAGENSTLNVEGDSVQPPGASGAVGWLTTAFKTLTLNVTLPGEKFTVIESITLSDLEIVMTDDSEAFAPLASSEHTLAQFKNPFGFSLQVVDSGENITLSSDGTDIAELVVPSTPTESGISTGNVADLTISFSNATLTSLNNDAFSAFFEAVTDTEGVSFELNGDANIVARTSIGDVPIGGIGFNVTTSLTGLNGLGGTAQLSNVSVTGSGGDGGSEYIVAPLTVALTNPSNISLDTDDVSFAVYYDNVKIGRAAIDNLNLVPGDNSVEAEFHYMPDDANDTIAQGFISDFVQSSDTLPLTIKGDEDSSPYESLVPALEGITIETSLESMNAAPIITHINVFITLDTLFDNLVSINFDLANPLDSDLTVTFSQVDSGVDNTTYAHFDQSFDSFVVPAGGTANSGTFGNVLLTKGALLSLGIIPLGYLDVFAAATIQVGDQSGYTLPWLHITQYHVPTTYGLSLSISEMQSILTNSTNSTSSASSILSGAGSAASSIVSGATSLAGSVVSGVTSAAGSIVSGVTSAAGSVVSEITSDAGSVVSEVTSGVGSVVSDVTSDAGSIFSDATSAIDSATSEAASAAGSVVSGIVGGITGALPEPTVDVATASSTASASDPGS